MLIVVAIIHILPLVGVLGAERLSVAYEVALDDPNLIILMRHRAVLFGLLGGFILYAAFNRELHSLAILAGFVSVLSFLVLSWQVGGLNAALRKVNYVDGLAMVCLLVALLIHITVLMKR